MELEKYFNDNFGTGVLATANAEGQVNTAVFSRPHITEDGKMVFIMGDKKTHANLKDNPRASFLFIEEGQGYKGKRFYLTMTAEEENDELVNRLCRRCREVKDTMAMETRHVVYFGIDRELPLIGSGS
ncbi:MAG: pyridoxamine 5'-phosphate oxidase family protein [Desulfurivibrionaceae bacterium]